MRRAFVHLALFFRDLQIAKIAERLLQQRARIEMLELLRPAGAVIQLLGRIALQDEQAAGLERAAHAGPFQRSLRRRRELGEDLDHDIEGRFRIGPGMHVGLHQIRRLTLRSAASARAFFCAVGEKSIAVTSSPCSASQTPLRLFAVGDRQRAAGFRQQRLAGGEEIHSALCRIHSPVWRNALPSARIHSQATSERGLGRLTCQDQCCKRKVKSTEVDW